MAHYPICKGKYCGQVSATRLVYDFAWRLKDFQEKYSHIKEVISIAMTRESKLMVKRFGFVKDTSFHSHPGWELWVIDTATLVKQAPALIKRLEKKMHIS
ncbi:hypothetical protein TI05_04880 [Achromatium sp. WMS3]|nr:hypothetical protein TI05_04880 [Achromatium sp. WMS3]